MEDRRAALDGLYHAVGELQERVGGPRLLRDCDGRLAWPSHGVYLFFEAGEMREDRVTPRIVRVGTHALTATSRTTLCGTGYRSIVGALAAATPVVVTIAGRSSVITSARR